MKYGSKMASITLIRAENGSRRVEMVGTGPKIGERRRNNRRVPWWLNPISGCT